MSNYDHSLVKKPNLKQRLSIQQIQEFAKCADPVTGPMYFMEHYFHIQHPTRGELVYHPFEYQRRLIDTYHNNRFSISMLPRQSGKTVTAAGYLLWYAMFVSDSTILVAAHKYIGAQEIMQRIRYGYELCPDHIRAGVTNYNRGSVEFDNGSRIVSQTTTESTGRGMSISLLYCDEFSYVRPSIAKEFWASIRPTLATGGKAIITSTPNSDEDEFSILWRDANDCNDEFGNETNVGKNGFKAYRAFWHEHPERNEDWARQERASLGEERFRREIDCEFIRDDETLVNPLKLVLMEGKEPLYKHGQIRWYKKPEKKYTYCIALDPSIGTGGDPAAIQVLELPSLVQVAEWKHNKTPIEKQISLVREICDYLIEQGVEETKIYYSIENNTVGEAGLVVIREQGEETFKGIFLSETKELGKTRKYRKGFTTTNPSKTATCAKLKSLVESDRLTLNSKALISELKSFIALGNSYQAKIGETDDLVMALVLAIRMMQVLQKFDAEIDMKIRNIEGEEVLEPLPFLMSYH